MTYIITEPCIDLKDKSCIDVCPVDCIHETDRMLVIDPEECIDCGACEPECPVEAIYPEDAVPDKWEPFIRINYLYSDGIDAVNAAVEKQIESSPPPQLSADGARLQSARRRRDDARAARGAGALRQARDPARRFAPPARRVRGRCCSCRRRSSATRSNATPVPARAPCWAARWSRSTRSSSACWAGRSRSRPRRSTASAPADRAEPGPPPVCGRRARLGARAPRARVRPRRRGARRARARARRRCAARARLRRLRGGAGRERPRPPRSSSSRGRPSGWSASSRPGAALRCSRTGSTTSRRRSCG